MESLQDCFKSGNVTHISLSDVEGLPCTSAYRAIEAAAHKHDLLTRYPLDLYYYDRKDLAHEPSRFGWMLRPSGTDVLLHGIQAGLVRYQIKEKAGGHPYDATVLGFWHSKGVLKGVSLDKLEVLCRSLPASYCLHLPYKDAPRGELSSGRDHAVLCEQRLGNEGHSLVSREYRLSPECEALLVAEKLGLHRQDPEHKAGLVSRWSKMALPAALLRATQLGPALEVLI